MNTITEQEVKPVQPATAETPRDYVLPGVNIFETTNAFVLEAEMPGVGKQGLSINVEGDVLTLEGRRQGTTPEGSVLYQESEAADFRRTFALDPSIESEKISARIEQGILTVTLPKAEKAKPRRITVS